MLSKVLAGIFSLSQCRILFQESKTPKSNCESFLITYFFIQASKGISLGSDESMRRHLDVEMLDSLPDQKNDSADVRHSFGRASTQCFSDEVSSISVGNSASTSMVQELQDELQKLRSAPWLNFCVCAGAMFLPLKA